MTDDERKNHNTWVLAGHVLEHSDDGRGKRLIAKDGRVFIFDDKQSLFREVKVLAKEYVEPGHVFRVIKGKHD